MAESVHLVPPGWQRSILIGHMPDCPSVRVLAYADGTLRMEHKCRIIAGTQVICAPALGDAHTVVNADRLTITPSIDCPDCDLHGFITDGRWIDATTGPAPEPTRQPLWEGPGGCLRAWAEANFGPQAPRRVQVFAAAPQDQTDG